MPLKFAVVREDPDIELACMARFGARRVLLCGSGGDTALAVAHRYPLAEITLYDFNPMQIHHIRTKATAVSRGDLRALNIGDSAPDGLGQCGEFEALFRVMRAAVLELVASEDEVERYFHPDTPPEVSARLAQGWVASVYWPAVFAVTFPDALLVAMFGPDAIQHAEPGSYPAYFQGVFTRGLLDPKGPRNPFLQHIFLQRYRREDAPPHLTAQTSLSVDVVQGGIPDVPALEGYDLVHLSNIFDWADDRLVARWVDALDALRSGAVVIIRQLNNPKDRRPLLRSGFRLEEALAAQLLDRDRSLFYDQLLIAVRQ